MMLMMPLMSLWFTFQVPAGVGIYWIISNLVMMVQSMILNKVYNPTQMAEKYVAEEAARKEQERAEKIAARKLLKEKGMENAAAALSQKEIDRQKLQAARRRDAEKYGDYPECFQTPEEDKKKK
jgi:YidC/Oxa1 family membrane protein insertase